MATRGIFACPLSCHGRLWVTRKGIGRLIARSSSSNGTRSHGLRALLFGVISTSLVAVLLVSAGAPASADPPLTVEDAKAQISTLETEAEALDQQYVGVKEQLDRGRLKLKLKKADVAVQEAKVSRMRLHVGQVALAQFQNRDLDTAAQLFFSSDTERFLSQISTVEKVNENQNSVLQDYLQQQADLDELERSAEADLAALRSQEKELAKLRTASTQKIRESKAVLARLTGEERRRIAEERRKAAAEAREEAEKATSSSSRRERSSSSRREQSSSRESSQESTTASVSGSSRGIRALNFAKAQLGDPYRYASDGPDSYDCSGLTSASWRAAGVTLPRTSSAQYGVGRSVSRSELALGDLVFFYSPISHVALYAGNGMIIHSPKPGGVVEYMKMSYMPYAGARRPG
jgi:peptidoglycan DL-endopeptidase CwlO